MYSVIVNYCGAANCNMCRTWETLSLATLLADVTLMWKKLPPKGGEGLTWYLAASCSREMTDK